MTKLSIDTILTDAIVEHEGTIQPYTKILKFLTDRYDIFPKGEFEQMVSEAWDASKDRESYLWDPKPWEAGRYIPKTKQDWLSENGLTPSEPLKEEGIIASNGLQNPEFETK